MSPSRRIAGERAGDDAPPATPLLPFEVTQRTLENGLKVIVVPTGLPNLVSFQIPVQTGSRNEVEEGKSGFAHFFEHMMFRGTEAYPAAEYQAILMRAGARNNAYTTDDYTNYHITFAKEDLETILAIEADRFRNLQYSEEDFKTEARAVLGEYNKDSASPIRKLLEVQRDHAFRAHTYKHTTMGFLRDIEAMPDQFEYSHEFFQRWYRPEHTTLIVAGDVAPERVLSLAQKHWGAWEPGNQRVEIPEEPAPEAPVYAHVPWSSPTLPWVTVAFHGPGFSEIEKDFAAIDMLLDLTFGPTSELYKRLVQEEQRVDDLSPYVPGNADPYLATVIARVKKLEDVVYVRDEILRALAEMRSEPVPVRQLEDAQNHNRFALLRGFDNTEAIASTLARFVRYRRSYETLGRLYATYDSLSPLDLQSAARRYVTDERLVITTLFQGPAPEGLADLPALDSLLPDPGAVSFRTIEQDVDLPQVVVKLLFRVGSAHDPEGKEGLAALAAAMVAEAGSRDRRIDEVRQALFPIAGSFRAQVDREMTTFTASVHRDNWDRFAEIVLPMLLRPGLRDEDFQRLRDAQRVALEQDLRANNEEELGKERLQANLFAGTRYGHTSLGTVAGLAAITSEDVAEFQRRMYSQANLVLGVSGRLGDESRATLAAGLAELPEGPTAATAQVTGYRPAGIEVEIVEKETRATAISFGHPIEVTRSHRDFPALWLARAWLGEHRSSVSRLYQRIRELRGMNYGDYAYIEAFPGGMFLTAPEPNVARRAQLFEVWIRPVAPENAHMALRIAIHELQRLVEEGMSEAQFQKAREYALKSVFLLTARQEQQLGYALDSQWYGIGDFTSYLCDRIGTLTRDQVNETVRRHLSPQNLSVVIITRDAEDLKRRLVGDTISEIRYDAEKPAELLAEDRLIGAKRLGIAEDAVRITPVEDVFAN